MTKNFNLDEFLFSTVALSKGIANNPSSEVIEQLEKTAIQMEKVRLVLGSNPIKINSGYRSPELNEVVNGSVNSGHLRGEAVDFTCPKFGRPYDIVKALEPLVKELKIDQVILEGAWVHISFNDRPRNQVLTFKNGKFYNGVVV